MRISDWSSDVCSSDLLRFRKVETGLSHRGTHRHDQPSPERGPHEAGRTAIPEEFTPPDVEMIDVIRSRLMQSMFESHEVTLSLVLFPCRSEERRVGKECVSTCRSRWSPSHYKKKQQPRVTRTNQTERDT